MPAVGSLRCASLGGRAKPCTGRRHAMCDVAHVAQVPAIGAASHASRDRPVSRIVRPWCRSPLPERLDLACLERSCHTVPVASLSSSLLQHSCGHVCQILAAGSLDTLYQRNYIFLVKDTHIIW